MHILIVDDDATVLETLSDCLTRLGKEYAVEIVASGLDALEAVDRQRPDLVLFDLTLPDFSGAEVLKLIHRMDARIRVIVMTDVQDSEGTDEAMASGAFACIPKPISVNYLDNLFGAALQPRRWRR